MIGAIVFILSMLVLGFCVISPADAHKVQSTVMGVLGRLQARKGVNNVMAQLADTPTQSSTESLSSDRT